MIYMRLSCGCWERCNVHDHEVDDIICCFAHHGRVFIEFILPEQPDLM